MFKYINLKMVSSGCVIYLFLIIVFQSQMITEGQVNFSSSWGLKRAAKTYYSDWMDYLNDYYRNKKIPKDSGKDYAAANDLVDYNRMNFRYPPRKYPILRGKRFINTGTNENQRRSSFVNHQYY